MCLFVCVRLCGNKSDTRSIHTTSMETVPREVWSSAVGKEGAHTVGEVWGWRPHSAISSFKHQTKGVHQVKFKTNGEMGKRKRREKEEMHTIKIKYLFNYLQAAANENHKRVVCLAVVHPESPAQ